MTQVITRYFDDAARARTAERELLRERFARNILRVYTEVDGLVDALTEVHVDPETAEAYRWRMENGGAVVLVLAGHKPLGVATTARAVMAQFGAEELGNVNEDRFIADAPGGAAYTSAPPHLC